MRTLLTGSNIESYFAEQIYLHSMKFFYHSFLSLHQNVKQEKIGIDTTTTIPTRSVFFHSNLMELNITNALIMAGQTQTTMK